MLGAFDQHQLLRFGRRSNESFEFGWGTELIAGSAHKQLGLRALLQEVECIHPRLFRSLGNRNDRRSDTNDRTNSSVCTSGTQSDRRAERESGEQQRQMILGIEPVERSADVVNFAIALVVLALTQSRSTKVEAQHGKAKTVQRLHGMEHDFVVQRSAKQRVRMADQRRMSGVSGSGVQQRLQASSRAIEKQGPDR